MKFHLTLVELEVGSCMECVLKLGNLGQPFLVLRRKVGSVIFLSVFYVILSQKCEVSGYPQRIL